MTGYPSAENPPSTEMVREAYAYIPTAAGGVNERREQAFDAWLAEHDREVMRQGKEQGWFDALNAIAWCIEHGSTGYADAIEYVAKNNPHRGAEPDDARDDGTCPACRGGSSAEFPCRPCGSTGRLPQGHDT